MSIRSTFEVQEKRQDEWLTLAIFDNEKIAEDDTESLLEKTENEIRIVKDVYNPNTLNSEKTVIFSSSIRKNMVHPDYHVSPYKGENILIWKGLPIDVEMLRYSGITMLVLISVSFLTYLIS